MNRAIARVSSIRLTIPRSIARFYRGICRSPLPPCPLPVKVKMKRRKKRERKKRGRGGETEGGKTMYKRHFRFSNSHPFRERIDWRSGQTPAGRPRVFQSRSDSVVYRWCGRAPNNSCTRRGIVCIGTVRHGPMCFRCLFLQIPHSTDTESDQTRVTKCRAYEGGGEEGKKNRSAGSCRRSGAVTNNRPTATIIGGPGV